MSTTSNEIATIIGYLVGIIFLLILGPLAVIWALNTLFPSLNIPYDLSTWTSVAIISAMLRARVDVKK
jgi:hypothetical protein